MKRRLFLWILVIVFIWLVVTRFTDIRKLAMILVSGEPVWIFAALLSQMAYYLTFSILYHSALDTVEVRSRILGLLPIMFGSVFINAVAPSGGMAGASLFVDDAARRGESPARAAAGSLLVLLVDLVSFSLVLVVGMAYLFTQHDLKFYVIIGGCFLILFALGISAVLLIGLWNPDLLHRLLNFIEQRLNGLRNSLRRLFRQPDDGKRMLQEGWAETNAEEFIGASSAISRHPRRLIRTFLIGLGCHLIDLVTVSCLFLAYRQHVSFGVLVAGYAVGILFWLVSITPQGIGVVEGVMAITFASLNVPGEVATVVALAFRGLTFWIPMMIGFTLLQRSRIFSPGERVQADVWNVRIVSILTAIMGVINVLSGATPGLANRLRILRQYSPLEVTRGGHLTAVLAGFALLLLARSLWRRKRVAWLMALLVLLVSIVSHLVKGLDYEEAGLSAVLFVWLLVLRDHFHPASDRPSVQQGLRVMVIAFVFTISYGVLGFYLLDRHFKNPFGLIDALRRTVVMFTQFYDPSIQPITGFGRFFASSIYIVGVVTFGYAILMLIRPVLVREPATLAQRQRASEIVERYGCSSLARFTLLPDKAYYFSSGGSMIAYVAKSGIALVLGDPIGPEKDIPQVLKDFHTFCYKNDWLPAYYQTQRDYLDEYRSLGYQVLSIGHEAIVDLSGFSLQGSANKNIRNSYNRMIRLGFKAEFHEPPHAQELVAELHEISDEWITLMHGTEQRFAVGWFDEEYVRSSWVVTICSPENINTAFANLLPEYQKSEVTVDMMRHRPHMENGTMDLLFVAMLMWAQEHSYATFNLGLSALSGIGEHSDDPAIERALRYIYRHVNSFYNFQGLHAFKEKFHPVWSPRYLIYPGAANLPSVAVAIIQADTGEGRLTAYLEELIKENLRKPHPSSSVPTSGKEDKN